MVRRFGLEKTTVDVKLVPTGAGLVVRSFAS